MSSRHRYVDDMVNEYMEELDYNDDYDDYDDEYVAPTPKPKPKPKPKATITPKKTAQNSPKSTPKKDNISSLTKKIAKINVQSEIDNRLATEKPVIYMVVIGHVDSGKSTLVGQLSVSGGTLSHHDATKLQQLADESGKSSFGLAYMMDQTDTERERGVTVDVGSAKFIQLDKIELALLDAPGHKVYFSLNDDYIFIF